MKVKQWIAGIAAASVLAAGGLVFAEEQAPNECSAMLIPLQLAPVSAPTEEGFAVNIDNVPLDLHGARPYLEGETLMLPLRAVSEALGYTVTWVEGERAESSSVSLANGDVLVNFSLQDPIVLVQNVKASDAVSGYQLPAVPVLAGERTYVPAEFFKALIGDMGVTVKEQLVLLYTPAYRAELEQEPAKEPEAAEPPVEIANPWKEYTSAEEVSAALGFDIKLPANIKEHYQCATIRAMEQEKMLELLYIIPETGVQYEICVRVRPTEEFADISGDYTEYPYTDEIEMGGNRVYVRGENGIRTALWFADGYSYSVTYTNSLEKELSFAELSEIYENVQEIVKK